MSTQPLLSGGCLERRKELPGAISFFATEKSLEPRGHLPGDRCPTRGQKGWLEPNVGYQYSIGAAS